MKVSILLFFAALGYCTDTLNVGIYEYIPMVINTSGGYEGYDIELWDSIAKVNSIPYNYCKVDSFQQLFDDLKSGKLDAVISGISITKDREIDFDFTHRYFQSGLGILTLNDSSLINKIKSRYTFFTGLLISLIPYFISWMIYVCFWAFLIWFFERGNPDFNDKFGPGFPDARFFVHVVISSTGFGNQIPKSVWGRRMTVVLMYSGIGFMFPMITGKISSEMTTYKMTNTIESKEDLKGVKVAVIKGTTSVSSVKKLGSNTIEVKDIPQALELIRNNEVLAVVYDIPALKYLEKASKRYRVLDDTFDDQDYGIMFAEKSPLKEKINRTILDLQEKGFLASLKNKWLGSI